MYVLDFPLSRLSYAAHTEDAVDVSRAGLAAWVGRQLDPKIRGTPVSTGAFAHSSFTSNMLQEAASQRPMATPALGQPWMKCGR